MHSTIADEVLSLQKGIDQGIHLQQLLEEILSAESCFPVLEAIVDNNSVRTSCIETDV